MCSATSGPSSRAEPVRQRVVPDDAVEDDLQRPGRGEAHRRLDEHRDENDREPAAVRAEQVAHEAAHPGPGRGRAALRRKLRARDGWRPVRPAILCPGTGRVNLCPLAAGEDPLDGRRAGISYRLRGQVTAETDFESRSTGSPWSRNGGSARCLASALERSRPGTAPTDPKAIRSLIVLQEEVKWRPCVIGLALLRSRDRDGVRAGSAGLADRSRRTGPHRPTGRRRMRGRRRHDSDAAGVRAALANEALASAPTSPMPFIGIQPCRIADTRNNRVPRRIRPALDGGERLAQLHSDRAVRDSLATAQAVSLNVTVTDTLGTGYILIYPKGGGAPGVSTLNYVADQTVANAAIVPLERRRRRDGGGGRVGRAADPRHERVLRSLGNRLGQHVLGDGAGNFDMTGDTNTALGAFAFQRRHDGSANTAVGLEPFRQHDARTRTRPLARSPSRRTRRASPTPSATARSARTRAATEMSPWGSPSASTLDGDDNTAVGPAASATARPAQQHRRWARARLDSNDSGNDNTGVGVRGALEEHDGIDERRLRRVRALAVHGLEEHRGRYVRRDEPHLGRQQPLRRQRRHRRRVQHDPDRQRRVGLLHGAREVLRRGRLRGERRVLVRRDGRTPWASSEPSPPRRVTRRRSTTWARRATGS